MFKSIYVLIITAFTIMNLSCGDDNSVNNSEESNLYVWGYGWLGDGNNGGRNKPTNIGNSKDWISITSSYRNTFGIKQDGTLWAWGQLQDSLTGFGYNMQLKPAQVGISNDWKSISAGSNHLLMIKQDGSLWAWGSNKSGQLGDGTYEDKNMPIRIGTSNDWSTIATRGSYSLGIKKDGSLWQWGYIQNESFDGNGEKLNIPTRIGISNDWQIISTGGEHSLGIKQDGSLWAWGLNSNGQLGDNTQKFKSVPTKIGVSNDWSSISAGIGVARGGHSLGIKQDGSLWAWGSNASSKLGDSSIINQIHIPTRIGNLNDWLAISAGENHSLGIKQDGSLWAWGSNTAGKLGISINESRKVPTKVGNLNDWKVVSASWDHSVAIRK